MTTALVFGGAVFLYLTAVEIVKAISTKEKRGRLAHASLHFLIALFLFAGVVVKPHESNIVLVMLSIFTFGVCLTFSGWAVTRQPEENPTERMAGYVSMAWGIITFLGVTALFLFNALLNMLG